MADQENLESNSPPQGTGSADSNQSACIDTPLIPRTPSPSEDKKSKTLPLVSEPDSPTEDGPSSSEAIRSFRATSMMTNDPESEHSIVPMDDESYLLKGRPNQATNIFAKFLAAGHKFFLYFPVQVIMILVTLLDVSFLIYEFVRDTTHFEVVTLLTSLSFFIELTFHLGHQGLKQFIMFDKWWMISEMAIVTISFVVEYLEFILQATTPESDFHKYVRYMRAARFLRVIILMKTRHRKLTQSLRRLVSADRRRYQDGGWDLDLTYVHPRIIAMSWPSERAEAFYRNNIDTVAHFLDAHHPNGYRVFNLCSERAYDESKFHYWVSRFYLDDHNPAELQVMLDFAETVDGHLRKKSENVAVIHCKGGKGRTGTMVCTYLLFSGIDTDAAGALKRFGTARTSESAKSFQGVESPSQERFVRYFDRLLNCKDRKAPQRRVRLKKLRLNDIPSTWWDVGKIWFAIISRPNRERTITYKSNPLVTFSAQLPQMQKVRSKTMSPAAADKAGEEIEQECNTYFQNMIVYVKPRTKGSSALEAPEEVVDPSQFVEKYATKMSPQQASKTNFVKASGGSIALPDVTVSVEFSTALCPAFEQDTVIKFFYNVDNPNTLHAPLQVWLHPSFEGSKITWNKSQLDGPHKDLKKDKKYPPGLSLDIEMEDVS